MFKKIRAQLINDSDKEIIREHFFDSNGETLESILQKIEKYVIYENMNSANPIRIKVEYFERKQ